MGLYLLVEKSLRGQRLGNLGLNVDENIRNREEKTRMGLKVFGRPRVRCGAIFFKTKFGLKMKRLAGPGPFKREKTMGRQKLLYCACRR